jgi:hypothetical protein
VAWICIGGAVHSNYDAAFKEQLKLQRHQLEMRGWEQRIKELQLLLQVTSNIETKTAAKLKLEALLLSEHKLIPKIMIDLASNADDNASNDDMGQIL